jgi:hypothetical protein
MAGWLADRYRLAGLSLLTGHVGDRATPRRRSVTARVAHQRSLGEDGDRNAADKKLIRDRPDKEKKYGTALINKTNMRPP